MISSVSCNELGKLEGNTSIGWGSSRSHHIVNLVEIKGGIYTYRSPDMENRNVRSYYLRSCWQIRFMRTSRKRSFEKKGKVSASSEHVRYAFVLVVLLGTAKYIVSTVSIFGMPDQKDMRPEYWKGHTASWGNAQAETGSLGLVTWIGSAQGVLFQQSEPEPLPEATARSCPFLRCFKSAQGARRPGY
jgi:hypothetical protein